MKQSKLNKKIGITIVIVLLTLTIVSAVWYNPFTWFSKQEPEIIKTNNVDTITNTVAKDFETEKLSPKNNKIIKAAKLKEGQFIIDNRIYALEKEGLIISKYGLDTKFMTSWGIEEFKSSTLDANTEINKELIKQTLGIN